MTASSQKIQHLISLKGWDRSDLGEIFQLATQYEAGTGPRFDGAVGMFFPQSSVRTRASFERGAYEMGLQPIVFPPEALDKDEDVADVARYLSQWVDLIVVRHRDITVLERLADTQALPVVNAMTDVNHPCEVLADLYAVSRDGDVGQLRFLFVGADGNIARAWWEAAETFDLDLRQCCPADVRTAGVPWEEDIRRAIASADVVVTDNPGPHAELLAPYQITGDLLDHAPRGVRFSPCPPFVRGREVSADAIAHRSFVGYAFKRVLKPVQQAVMAMVLLS